jgi:type II secretory ATPase GspE/PulE/Tfp pilus assembly ATPase PilB-like protein
MIAPALLVPADDFDARPVVAALVDRARALAASDLHLRPNGRAVEVLARRDGILQHQFDLPAAIYDRLLVGLKNMARLAAYKKSVPQEGRLRLDALDVRVATTPTHFGEKVVMRLVGDSEGPRSLSDLGLPDDDLERLRAAVEQPQGLILASGPAGSGKTTTLYAIIRHLMARHRARLGPMKGATLNVVTLEDPIECVMPEITQTAILPELGMTFASGLRSMLRQDPEVLLVGEIRDPETAAAAVQCGLTGHLVLSTLHARDAVGAIPRLRELGVEPYMLGAALVGVIYQRLLRRLCPDCRRPVEAEAACARAARALGVALPVSHAASGCASCDRTGTRGRLAVAEILTVDDGLRQRILDGASVERLQTHARDGGMRPLLASALARVAEGTAGWEEVERTVGSSARRE